MEDAALASTPDGGTQPDASTPEEVGGSTPAATRRGASVTNPLMGLDWAPEPEPEPQEPLSAPPPPLRRAPPPPPLDARFPSRAGMAKTKFEHPLNQDKFCVQIRLTFALSEARQGGTIT